MRKEQKTEVVQRLTDNLRRATIVLVSEQNGLSAGEADDMRRRLRGINSELQVAKNTLVRLALKDTRYSTLDTNLGGPIGLVLGYADPVELAKALGTFKDLGDKFKVRGGVLDGKPLTAEEITALAALPPREVILGQLLGLIQAPATRIARLLNEPGSALARVLDAISKRQAEGAAPPEPGAAPPEPGAAAPEPVAADEAPAS